MKFKLFSLSKLFILVLVSCNSNSDRKTNQPESKTTNQPLPHSIGVEDKGGIIVYEDNGYGLVVTPKDLGVMTWDEANSMCQNLSFNGYNDWRLPNKEELAKIYFNLKTRELGGFGNDAYWGSDDTKNGWAWWRTFDRDFADYGAKSNPTNVRAVRNFAP